MDRRYITPERVIAGRFRNEADIPQWDVGVLCFRDAKGSRALVEALRAVPVGRKVFWGVEETAELPAVYAAKMEGKSVVIATGCIWGGPQAAILVEELSAMGVKHVVGYGAAGSLDASLPQGTQVVVGSAPAMDGTSRQYGAGPFHPAPAMVELVPSARHVTAATVDAVYRETASLVRQWVEMGAHVVNMEAAAFYAAASACGVGAVWIGHVSDLLVGEWKDWYVDRRGMSDGTVENCLGVLRGL